MTDPREARLRERLASYGAALDEAATVSATSNPRRHLVAVDGPVGGHGRRRPPWRGPARRRAGEWRKGTARAAAVVVVLGALAGTTWAATRPTDPTTTASTERGWADDDTVRREDWPSAFAALDGTWPLPPGGSIRYVLDLPDDARQSFAGFRQMLAYNADCLWFRYAYEDPDLSSETREALEELPTWPGNDLNPGSQSNEILRELVTAALDGDVERLRRHLSTNCTGTGVGLGLPEVDGRWLVASSSPGTAGGTPLEGGSATAIDVTQVRGWDAIAARFGPDVDVEGALRLPGAAYNVALVRGGLHLSLTIEQLRGAVQLPISEADFDAGHEIRFGGIEVYAGPAADGAATIAHVVGPEGESVTLSFAATPGRVDDALGDLADLAVDLHAVAWPR